MSYGAIFIVCEFDPFHFGHKYLIDCARALAENSPIICIMSGNFTQRGECAVIDKYDRAKAAVLCGADLVLSLPVQYSSACAELFARGAVRIAKEISCGDDCALLFGSESGDIKSLTLCAERISSLEFTKELDKIKGDMQYPKKRADVYKEIYGDDGILSSPNNVLGIEYIKAINKYAPNIRPLTVKRAYAEHNSTKTAGKYASATYIRGKTDTDEYLLHVPKATHEIYKGANFPANIRNAEKIILSKLRNIQGGDYSDCGGGLLEMISDRAKKSSSYDELLQLCATKKYTNAKIRRAILSAVLGISEEDRKEAPSYTLLLGADGVGLEYLSKTKKRHRNLCIITKPSDHTSVPQFMLEAEADNLFSFMMPKTAPFNYSIRKTPFILKDGI